MRLFIAINLSDAVKDGLINMQAVDQIIRSGECGRWLPVEQ